jgi:hypothetical protein
VLAAANNYAQTLTHAGWLPMSVCIEARCTLYNSDINVPVED